MTAIAGKVMISSSFSFDRTSPNNIQIFLSQIQCDKTSHLHTPNTSLQSAIKLAPLICAIWQFHYILKELEQPYLRRLGSITLAFAMIDCDTAELVPCYSNCTLWGWSTLHTSVMRTLHTCGPSRLDFLDYFFQSRGGGGYLDLSFDGDVPFCPKNWYP